MATATPGVRFQRTDQYDPNDQCKSCLRRLGPLGERNVVVAHDGKCAIHEDCNKLWLLQQRRIDITPKCMICKQVVDLTSICTKRDLANSDRQDSELSLDERFKIFETRALIRRSNDGLYGVKVLLAMTLGIAIGSRLGEDVLGPIGQWAGGAFGLACTASAQPAVKEVLQMTALAPILMAKHEPLLVAFTVTCFAVLFLSNLT